MAVKNLKNLVLRGSAVLLVGKAGNPRRGSGSTANPETPEICISMRLPSHNAMQEFQPPALRLGHADYCRVDSVAAYGAGRSLRCAGILSRSRMRWASSTVARLTMAVSTARLTIVTSCLAVLAWCKPCQAMLTASA
jgi:hypothetical protein